MTSRTLRRSLHHGDVDGRLNELHHSSDLSGVNEPLVVNYDSSVDDNQSKMQTLEDVWNGEQRTESLHWTFLLVHLIMQWTQSFARIIVGSGYVLGRLFLFPSLIANGSLKKMLLPPLTPLQEERLRKLKLRLAIPFDISILQHQYGLRQLWSLAYPGRQLPALKTELWKEMGWQGTDPSTDFRAGGFASLENLIFFATKYPVTFQSLLHKKDGKRAEWEYPFAVAGINISFMLVHMLDLQSGRPSCPAGIKFLELLTNDEMEYDTLYCVAFQLMDAIWLAKGASYMEFSEVLKMTRTQLERELKLENISSVRDLPAYKFLKD